MKSLFGGVITNNVVSLVSASSLAWSFKDNYFLTSQKTWFHCFSLAFVQDCEHVSQTAEEFYTVRCQVADMKNIYVSNARLRWISDLSYKGHKTLPHTWRFQFFLSALQFWGVLRFILWGHLVSSFHCCVPSAGANSSHWLFTVNNPYLLVLNMLWSFYMRTVNVKKFNICKYYCLWN